MATRHRIGMIDGRPDSGRNVLLLGVWLRAAFAGAAVAAAGVAALFDPSQGLSVLTAITWTAAGATFAWLAWQRAGSRLERLDAEERTVPDHDRDRDHVLRIPTVASMRASS